MKKIINIWKQLSVAKKASLTLIFAKFCQKGIAMISTPIFTRIMDTDQYGAITNFMSWQSIFLIIATLNISQGVFNNGMLEYSEDRDRFTSSALVLANTITIIIFGLYFGFGSFFRKVVGVPDSLMLIMFGYMLFFPAFSYWSSRERYEFRYKLLGFVTIATSFAQMALGILAVLLCKNTEHAGAKLLATEGVMIVTGLIFYVYIIYKAHFKFSLEYIKYAFKFNIFLIPHFLAMTVLASGDRIMINSMVGATETAIYGVSYTAASMILIFGQAVEASWIPWLYERLHANNLKGIPQRANQIACIYATVSLLCMLFAPEIMGILASKSYQEGIFIIPSVTAGVYFSLIYALYMRLEYYSKKTKATMFGSVAVALLNVALNYACIKLFGYIAAGYTTLICYILLYLFHFWYSRRIGMKNIYNDRTLGLISTFIVICSIVITVLYHFNYIRYMLIVAIFILIIINYKKIKQLLAGIKK